MEKVTKYNEALEIELNKYAKREISLGMAAEIAEVPIADFMVIAAKRKIPINYTIKWLEEDFKAVLKANSHNV